VILTRSTVAALSVLALAHLPESRRAEVLLAVSIGEAFELLGATTDVTKPQLDDPSAEDVDALWQSLGPTGQARFRDGLLRAAAS